MEERIIELETKLAYQEDLLQQLNDLVTEHTVSLSILAKQYKAMEEQFHELQEQLPLEGTNEKPPHY